MAVSLAALAVFPDPTIRSLAYGGVGVVLTTMVTAVTLLPALLAEPADDQQPVVDAEPDAQHQRDVDRVERDVGEPREAGERQQRDTGAAERHGQRQAGGEHAAEHDRHHHEGDRQRDHLGPLSVLLRQLGHLVVEQLLAADQHRRCVDGAELTGDVLDQVLVGVVAEARREDDLHGRGATVLGGEGVHRLDAGGRSHLGEHVLADGGAVDHGHHVAPVGSEAVEAGVEPLRLERRRPVEVGVEGGEQHPGGADAEDQDDEPPGRNAPGSPQGKGCESCQHAQSVRPDLRPVVGPRGDRGVSPRSDPPRPRAQTRRRR